MLKKIDHVGIAVKSLLSVKNLFENVLGMTPVFEEAIPDQGVKTLGYQVGESRVEFLEPLSENSPISKFLKKRGEGLHHICYEVDDLEATLDLLKSRDVQLIDEQPRTGAENKKIAFIHPGSMNGVLVELTETSKKESQT